MLNIHVEDRVMANISHDASKTAIFTDKLDGHSLNTLVYNYEEIADLNKLFKDRDDDSKGKYFKEVLSDNSVKYSRELDQEHKMVCEEITKKEFIQGIVGYVKSNHKDLRQDSKNKTFKLAYGGYPDIHKGGMITQEIFDNYHNVLHAGITKYRESYVIPTADNEGELHLLLGLHLLSDDAKRFARTILNASIQSFSLLTLVALARFYDRIIEKGVQLQVQNCLTVYDSIYLYADEDPELLKWINDTLAPIMITPYLKDEAVPNEAALEIGYSFAELIEIPNGCSVEHIESVINKLKEQ